MKQERSQGRKRDEEPIEPTKPVEQPKKSPEELKAELDEILDDIDTVLDENTASTFIRDFVQKGGQ